MASAKKKTSKASKKSTNDFYVDFFTLVAERGWFSLTLPEIAKATQHSLSELLKIYPDKTAILIGFGKKIDAQLADDTSQSTEPLKDKLFDMLMRRFDALAPYRAGVLRLLEDMQSHPISAVVLCLEAMCGFTRSMALIFEMVGISTSHPRAILGVMGLKIVYLSTLRTWKHDDSPDLSATMAILDRGLNRLIRVLRYD